jgi:membrane protease YdiL (CAAX protease family)
MLGLGWLLLAVGAFIYARLKGIPAWAAMPVAAAFLIEIPFYLSPGFSSVREWLTQRGRSRTALYLVISAVIPWLIYAIPTGTAQPAAFAMLLAAAAIVSFWYIVLPSSAITDALFLAAAAAIYLSKVFTRIYISPVPKLDISVLGHLMLIRTAALSVLTIRGGVDAEYRFIPARSEWKAGLRYFAIMLPVIAAVYWALGLVQLRTQPANPALTLLIAIGTFLAMLWVLALSEEFFFRGLLQQWLERWTRNSTAALVIASAIFGCAHLGFHRKFPNWQWAIVAGILGVFCGLAWRNTRSVQSSMVTHALLVTVWRVFLQ